MLRKFFTLLCFMFAVHGSAHAQIPVTDAMANSNLIMQLSEWAKQLNAMKQQYQQLKSTYDSLNGLRDIGGLMQNRLLEQYLPPDFKDAYQLMRNAQGGNLAGISGTLEQIANRHRMQSCNQQNQSQALVDACNRQWKDLAMGQFIGEKGYEQAAKNIQDLEQFINAIKSSPDAKTIADLQARIQVEQVKLQNESLKLQTVQMMQKAAEEMRRKSQAQAVTKSMSQSGFIRF